MPCLMEQKRTTTGVTTQSLGGPLEHTSKRHLFLELGKTARKMEIKGLEENHVTSTTGFTTKLKGNSG